MTKVTDRPVMPAELVGMDKLPLDVERIREILPHRYPFLMVDRIVEYNADPLWLAGIKNVTCNEPYFTGHFPEKSMMPGVLQVEAMAQVGAILALSTPEGQDQVCVLAGVDKARFRHPVVPGDQLKVTIEVLSWRRRFGKAQGRCEVDGRIVSEAEIMFAISNE